MADRSETNGRSSSKFETSDSCFLVFQNPCLPYLFSASRLNRGVSGQAALPSISSHSFRLTHAHCSATSVNRSRLHRPNSGTRLSTTAEIYTHGSPASQRAAVERLERAVWPQLDPSWKDSRCPVVNSSSDVSEVKWCARRDSNTRPLASEASALSS